MKTLFAALFSSAVLFVIGCQENSVTDPLATNTVNNNKLSDNFGRGTITLEGTLKDPYPVINSYYIVFGQVEYEFNSVNGDFSGFESKRYISVNLSTSADFRYFCTVCPPSPEDELAGFISDESQEYVAISGTSVSLLEKTFSIQGREDRMVLKCRFLVTSDKMELSAMWLALEDQSVTATVNQ